MASRTLMAYDDVKTTKMFEKIASGIRIVCYFDIYEEFFVVRFDASREQGPIPGYMEIPIYAPVSKFSTDELHEALEFVKDAEECIGANGIETTLSDHERLDDATYTLRIKNGWD